MQLKIPLFLDFFDFVERQIDERVATEDRHEHVEAALVVVDAFDATREVLEGACLTRIVSPTSNSILGRGFSALTLAA